MEKNNLCSNLMLRKSGNPLIFLPSYIFMENQLHVGSKADLSFNLRHFRPMKSFRWPRFQRKTNCFFKISGAIHTYTCTDIQIQQYSCLNLNSTSETPSMIFPSIERVRALTIEHNRASSIASIEYSSNKRVRAFYFEHRASISSIS